MKKMNKVFAAIIVFAAIGTSANAQTNVASINADAKIVAAITVASSRALNFGSIAPGTGGTVVIAATDAGARSKTGAVTYTNAATTSAKFTVSGEGNSTYSIAVTNPTISLVSGANTMSATLVASAGGTNAATATGTLASGTQDIFVGGTLTVTSGQAAGQYTVAGASAIEITVAY